MHRALTQPANYRTALFITILLVGCALCAHAARIRIDLAAPIGPVRDLHGVNNGPLNFGEVVDLSEYYRQLRIPLVRLHDCEWPASDLVDIHAIFPDSRADPTDPAAYRFGRTDAYVQAIVDTGARIVYRLGESIEHTRIKHHVHPPADPGRWAAVCLGMIRHYNQGWADGFRHDIRYWEIWNEPENRPNMWTGTDEDYFRLYEAAATAIKSEFPDLKVGGPSIGAPGEFVDGRFQPSAFLSAFLQFCRDRRLPLDFFSWHTYSADPFLYRRRAVALRALLDEYGFRQTEMHLNEWNYLPDNDWTAISRAGQGLQRRDWCQRQGGPGGAAFVAAVLTDLQDSPVDAGNFYSGDTNLFGLFDRYAVPKKTYYAFHAFADLLRNPTRVRVDAADIEPQSLTACAAVSQDGRNCRLLLSLLCTPESPITIELKDTAESIAWSLRQLDEAHDLAETARGESSASAIQLPTVTAPAVLLLDLQMH